MTCHRNVGSWLLLVHHKYWFCKKTIINRRVWVGPAVKWDKMSHLAIFNGIFENQCNNTAYNLISILYERLAELFHHYGFVQQNAIPTINSNTKILFLGEVRTTSHADCKLLLLSMAATPRDACHVVKSQKCKLCLNRQWIFYWTCEIMCFSACCLHEVETDHRFQARIGLVCKVSH